MFIKLYKSIFNFILNDWITMKEIVILDSSYTSKERILFLEHLFLLKEKECKNNNMLKFFITKKINIYSLSTYSKAFEKIVQFTPNIKKLYLLSTTNKILNRIVKYIDNLEVLQINHNGFTDYDIKLLSKFKLKELILIENYNDIDICPVLSNNLEKFTMLKYNDYVSDSYESLRFYGKIWNYLIKNCPNLISTNIPINNDNYDKLTKVLPNFKNLTFISDRDDIVVHANLESLNLFAKYDFPKLNCANLKRLILNYPYNNLGYNMCNFECLINIEKLIELNIEDCSISTQLILPTIYKMKKLKILKIIAYEIKSLTFQYLTHNTKILSDYDTLKYVYLILENLNELKLLTVHCSHEQNGNDGKNQRVVTMNIFNQQNTKYKCKWNNSEKNYEYELN